jgi:4-hydroxyphenylacetate 3-monooxygenase
MPARTGQQYLTGLREQKREVWFRGERVKDVTTQPGLARGARAIAALYDMQTDPKFRAEMTFTSPKTGDPLGLSFIIPRTKEDLEARRVMMLNWARSTCGMMGRSPDFMNVHFSAWPEPPTTGAPTRKNTARTCGATTSTSLKTTLC